MNKKLTGALIASAVAGLVLTGQVIAEESTAKPVKVKCEGGNACKGTSECHTATNGCGGENSCKGKGWIMTTEKECTDKGGKPVKE